MTAGTMTVQLGRDIVSARAAVNEAIAIGANRETLAAKRKWLDSLTTQSRELFSN